MRSITPLNEFVRTIQWCDPFDTPGSVLPLPGEPGKSEQEDTERRASTNVRVLEWTKWSDNNPHTFDTKSHRNTGPGEEKFAWEIGGTVHGSSAGTFDVLDQAGKMCEVKKISARYTSFRGGVHGRKAASQARERITRVCEILSDGIQSIEADVLHRLFEKNDGVTVPQILKFLSHDVPAISAGELSKGRILGNTHSNPIGLYQILRAISQTIANAKKCPDDLKIIFAKKIRSIDVKTYVKIAREMGMSLEEMDIDPTTYISCVFDDRAFREPDWFIQDVWFRTIKPSNVLGHVANVVLVRKDEFFVIPKEELDERLELVTVTKGDVKLKLSRLK